MQIIFKVKPLKSPVEPMPLSASLLDVREFSSVLARK
jgi:hypothetical protein